MKENSSINFLDKKNLIIPRIKFISLDIETNLEELCYRNYKNEEIKIIHSTK